MNHKQHRHKPDDIVIVCMTHTLCPDYHILQISQVIEWFLPHHAVCQQHTILFFLPEQHIIVVKQAI